MNMADKISFDLVCPERLLLSDNAEMVDLPGTDGDMGVMAGHMPLITTLRPGFIKVAGGESGEIRFFVMSGFAEITADKCTVLADEALPADEVDETKRQELVNKLETELADAATDSARAKLQFQLEGLKLLKV
jgi:F-type H+-transporting ATPase subunit epsilon